MTEKSTLAPARVEAQSTPEPVLFRPAAEVIEDEEQVHLRLDLPGVAESDLEITVEGETLTIQGRQQERVVEGYRAVRTEYATGAYRRVFSLSRAIDPGKIRARLVQGVLDVELPKRKEALPRTIPVHAG